VHSYPPQIRPIIFVTRYAFRSTRRPSSANQSITSRNIIGQLDNNTASSYYNRSLYSKHPVRNMTHLRNRRSEFFCTKKNRNAVEIIAWNRCVYNLWLRIKRPILISDFNSFSLWFSAWFWTVIESTDNVNCICTCIRWLRYGYLNVEL